MVGLLQVPIMKEQADTITVDCFMKEKIPT